MRFLTAENIHDGKKFLPDNTVLIFDKTGCFVDYNVKQEIDPLKVEHHAGIICPGFINAHCHLELSHLKGAIEQKKGLTEFAKDIIAKRNNFSSEEIKEAIVAADSLMYKEGIVAVGDISNTTDTLDQKSKSAIYYHTFVELLTLNPYYAELIFNSGKQLEDEFKKINLSVSLSPHAPYSVSNELFLKISADSQKIITIHNQECEAENTFFKQKTGSFLDLYNYLKLTIDYFSPTGKSSMQSYLPFLTGNSNLILVHNTFTNIEDARYANLTRSDLFWCLCPNANLYIENTLPDVKMLIEEDCRICIGTDSLASNTTLSVVNELNRLLKAFDFLNIEQVLTWAIHNGAVALNISDNYGSFIKGINAGINVLKLNETQEYNICKLG